MKIVIWLLCALAYGLIVAACKAAGIVLGGVPTVLLALAVFALAGFLTKRCRRKAPAIPAQQPEKWYTCPDCGQLVRDGEGCDCKAQQQDPPEAAAAPQGKRTTVCLAAACLALAVLAVFLGCKVHTLSSDNALLKSENGILSATLDDLSSENDRLEAQLSEGESPSFATWTQWKQLYDRGYISLPYDEYLVLFGN